MQSKNGSKRLRRQTLGTRVMAEALDRRLLMSGNPPAVLANGVLTVTGTSGADTIEVSSSQIGLPETSDSGDTWTTVVDGVTQTFPAYGISGVSINSGNGNDSVTYSVDEFDNGSPAVNAAIVVGNGKDTVDSTIDDNGNFISGPGATITAGDGDDYLALQGGEIGAITAGNGNDTLYAADTDDSLFATLTAGNGNDAFGDFTAGAAGFLHVTAMGGTGTDSFGTSDPDNPPLQGSVTGGESFSFDHQHSIITGRAFTDNFGTGVYQTGDTPLADAQVYVDTSNTGRYVSGDPTATTDANGNYLIAGLTPAVDGSNTDTYGVRVTAPAGYTNNPVYAQLIAGEGLTNQNPLDPPDQRGTDRHGDWHDGVVPERRQHDRQGRRRKSVHLLRRACRQRQLRWTRPGVGQGDFVDCLRPPVGIRVADGWRDFPGQQLGQFQLHSHAVYGEHHPVGGRPDDRVDQQHDCMPLRAVSVPQRQLWQRRRSAIQRPRRLTERLDCGQHLSVHQWIQHQPRRLGNVSGSQRRRHVRRIRRPDSF